MPNPLSFRYFKTSPEILQLAVMLYDRFPLCVPYHTAPYNMLLYNSHIGVSKMLVKGNVTVGLETRFGPDWPGVRCGARTKSGGKCQRPAVKRTGKCTRHGGKSTGPRTQAGRDKIAALHTTHGRLTKEKRQAAKKRAEIGRKVRAEIKQIEASLIEKGVLERNWRQDWKL